MKTLLDIGSILVAARRTRGVTQADLGERVGASQQQIARWESRAYANVDLARIAGVAQALGLEPGALVGPHSRAPLVAAEPVATYGGTPAHAEPGFARGPRPVGLHYSQSELESICRRRAVKRLALFGSALRDDFGPDSDVDVLVEFDHDAFEGRGVYLLPDELSRLFGGRRIDLVEAEFVSPRLRRHILSEAQYVFATG
jgi:hypothetical protein